MKKMILAVTTAVGILASVPANAAQYMVNYTTALDDGGSSMFSGIITTTDTADDDGFFSITSLTGARDGLEAVLSPLDTFGGNDNLFKPAPNYTTNGGFTYDAGGIAYNVYSFGSDFMREYQVGNITSFDVSSVTSAVPEPASWAMMMLGIGAVGATMRRRSKVSTTVKFA